MEQRMNTRPFESGNAPELSLREAQAQVDEWIQTIGVRYFSELTNLAILTEEVGELARLFARKFGDQSSKPSEEGLAIADELADILWVLCALANQTGVDLTDALASNVKKKTDRDSDRHQNNPKLNPK
jgi:NTP pyrophosphatase (non-canonical NTP hydrolase)